MNREIPLWSNLRKTKNFEARA